MTGMTGTLARSRLRVSEFDIEVVHSADVKHQSANTLFRLPTNGIDNSPLKDYLLGLTITEIQPVEEKTEKDAEIFHSLVVLMEWTP